MGRLSAGIRRKPEWWIKRKDPAILAKWREEALAATMWWNKKTNNLEVLSVDDERRGDTDSIVRLNEKQVDYVLQELGGYENLRHEESGIQARPSSALSKRCDYNFKAQVGCFDGIWQSDKLVPDQTRKDLISGVAVLEDVPENKKDWHPGSDDQVLDLVHPSLYCLVYGETKMYTERPKDNSHKPEAIPVPIPKMKQSIANVQSKKYSWIPTDFKVSDDGKVKALGYINNLFPGHIQLYKTIEECISLFIPMFERVLSDLRNPLPLRIEGEYSDISETDPHYPKEEEEPNEKSENVVKDDGDEEWEDEEDYYDKVDKFWEKWQENKYCILPDVPDSGYKGMLERRKVSVSLKGREIQVIVKLANIQLVRLG